MRTQIVGDLGFELDDAQKTALTNQTEFERVDSHNGGGGVVFVDYDDFVHKISDIAQKSSSKQHYSPQGAGTDPNSPQRNDSEAGSPTSKGMISGSPFKKGISLYFILCIGELVLVPIRPAEEVLR